MKRWEHNGDRHATKGERRGHTHAQQAPRTGERSNYRSGKQHERFADEVAEGQKLCDEWAARFTDATKAPRSR